jgi:hypothetical protein
VEVSIKVMSFVMENAPLVGGAYNVMLGLANWADDEGVTRFGASMGRLAWDSRLGQRQVRRVTARLEAHGLIERRGGGIGRGHKVQWRVETDAGKWSDEMRELGMLLASELAKGNDLAGMILTCELTLSTSPKKGDMMSSFRAPKRRTSETGKEDFRDMERRTSETSGAAATKSLISVRTVRSVRARERADQESIKSTGKRSGEEHGSSILGRVLRDIQEAHR